MGIIRNHGVTLTQSVHTPVHITSPNPYPSTILYQYHPTLSRSTLDIVYQRPSRKSQHLSVRYMLVLNAHNPLESISLNPAHHELHQLPKIVIESSYPNHLVPLSAPMGHHRKVTFDPKLHSSLLKLPNGEKKPLTLGHYPTKYPPHHHSLVNPLHHPSSMESPSRHLNR